MTAEPNRAGRGFPGGRDAPALPRGSGGGGRICELELPRFRLTLRWPVISEHGRARQVPVLHSPRPEVKGHQPGVRILGDTLSALLRHLPPGHMYRVIFMQRDIEEVLDSQSAMLGAAEPPGARERLRAAFGRHLQWVGRELDARPDMEVLRCGFEDALRDPLATAQSVSRFLGLALDTAAMAAAVSPGHPRHRRRGAPATGDRT